MNRYMEKLVQIFSQVSFDVEKARDRIGEIYTKHLDNIDMYKKLTVLGRAIK